MTNKKSPSQQGQRLFRANPVPSMRYKYIIVLFSVNVNGFGIFSDNFEKSLDKVKFL